MYRTRRGFGFAKADITDHQSQFELIRFLAKSQCLKLGASVRVHDGSQRSLESATGHEG